MAEIGFVFEMFEIILRLHRGESGNIRHFVPYERIFF